MGRGTDDGLPGPLGLVWSQEGGPGVVTFSDAHAATTTVQFDRQGTYVLRLAAADGLYEQHDTVTLVAADPATVPQAVDDFHVLDEDVPLAVAAPGILGNDLHGSGLPMTATVFVPPAHGTLVLGASGSIAYTPAANWFGTDTFLYKATDSNGATDVGRVTLQVNAVNDAPVAAGETYTVGVGGTLLFFLKTEKCSLGVNYYITQQHFSI